MSIHPRYSGSKRSDDGSYICLPQQKNAGQGASTQPLCLPGFPRSQTPYHSRYVQQVYAAAICSMCALTSLGRGVCFSSHHLISKMRLSSGQKGEIDR